MRLRDHDRPCEHGTRHEHTVQRVNSTVPLSGGVPEICPGGAEVVIDYGPIETIIAGQIILAKAGEPTDVREATVRVVDAVLGIVEDDA
jgi:hypothetical protein